MKTRIEILFIAFLVLSFKSYAKSQSGIYMTVTDFKNDKLVCANESGQKKTIRIHDFFWNMPSIRIQCGGKKITYKKSELYGFRDDKNDVYRFYNNTEYRIAEAGNIYVYVQERNITQSRGYKVVNAYYFSTAADAEIVPLTVGNLKSAYKGNEKFRDLLDQYFNTNDICEYDSQHHSFKVNYVYSKTIK